MDDRSIRAHQDRSPAPRRSADCNAGKRSSLTSSDLDEYHTRSEKIRDLYRELDTIARSRFQYDRPRLS